MKQTTFILAGNYNQALYHYGEQISRGKAEYLSNFERMFGVKHAKIIQVGTPFLRKDYFKIMDYAKAKNFKTIKQAETL